MEIFPNKELTEHFNTFDGKPFKIKDFFDLELLKEDKGTELALYVLDLNIYIQERVKKSIKDTDFYDLLDSWVKKNKKKKNNFLEFKGIIKNILIVCGIYVSYEILAKDKIANYNEELIKREKELLKAKYDMEETNKKFPEYKVNDSINKLEKDLSLLKLINEQNRIIINNRGNSIVTYIVIIKAIKEIQDITLIEKSKIIELICDCFFFLEIIRLKDKINFPDNLSRNLNRIRKDKVEDLFKIITEILFPPR